MPVRDAGPEPELGALVFAIGGAIARADIPALCERLQTLLSRNERSGATVICDVGELGRADAVAVEALARLRLTARRLGRRLQLRRASPELQALLALMGLAEILPIEPLPSLQPLGQTEEREKPRGIKKEGDAADPPIG